MILFGSIEWRIARAINDRAWDWGDEDLATYLCRTILSEPDVLDELQRRITRQGGS